MMRNTSYLWAVALLAAPAWAQTDAAPTNTAKSDAPPSFEVASVKALTGPESGGREGGGRGPMAFPGGRGGTIRSTPNSVTLHNTTLKNAIRWAYGVTEYQVSGPEWLNNARYEINAKASAPATEEQLQRMTQALLADRFKLAFHRVTKDFQVYVLAPGKNGTKLQESKEAGDSAIQPQQNRMSVSVQRTPISAMIDLLAPILGAPVLDETGLKGRYDVTVNVAKYMGDMQAGAGGTPPDPLALIQAALEGELGLKLEMRKMPLEVLIVDHAEKTPVEN